MLKRGVSGMNMINLTIDGIKTQVPEGTTILKAATDLGIDIPTLCYDPRLRPDGACRMCVVEVERARSLVTSCSTPVGEGMVVYTESPSVVAARKEILRLMWANHPYNCLTCEKAGNCKLQDYSYRYGITDEDIYYFQGEKRKREIDDSNKFYDYDPNKCILCGKCVRICSELQCMDAIGRSARGFDTHITPPFEAILGDSDCVSCGNCVSYCPTGALSPKKSVKYREWEVKRVNTTCAYCGVGCQLQLLVKDGRVVGVEPADGPSNIGLLCVKGKFGYNFINHPDRLTKPLIKKDGRFEETSWEEALSLVAEKLAYTRDNFGADAVAGLSSARCTNEENYLFQKLLRAVVGTNNVDHCARL
jgi:NADH-quinone oxidoreductase subunit G